MQKHSVTPPPKKGLRLLTLSYGDVDGGGSFELATVWAEDIYSIYDGTDSNIWSQLLAVDQGKLTPLGPLQAGYIRLTHSGGLFQQRGTYSAFSGPVKKMLYKEGKFSPAQSLLWGVQNIFFMTPWDKEIGLAWQE